MPKIQMTDLKAQYETIKSEIDAAIQSVITESSFILGKQVDLLEQEIAGYIGVKYAIGVASGTDALVLSLAALDIKEGDEIITTPFTFIATAEAISRVGAKPAFCDIDRDTYNIDADKIEAKITPKTKAIIPVHLYGMPCEMDKIMAVAKKHNLKVIEDCAQSFGSAFKGRKVGSIGDCGALSFFPAKTLGCYGDGGMVVTGEEETAKRIKMLRNHGSTAKYHYSVHGFNSRLDTLQAAILRVKLKYIDTWIAKRIENARYYNELLQGLSPKGTVPAESGAPNHPIGLGAYFNLQGTVPEYKHAFNYYTIRIKKNRDLVQERLGANNIACGIYYPLSLHLQEVYQGLGYKKGDFPLSEEAQDEVLSLPMYPELTSGQIQAVVSVIREALA